MCIITILFQFILLVFLLLLLFSCLLPCAMVGHNDIQFPLQFNRIKKKFFFLSYNYHYQDIPLKIKLNYIRSEIKINSIQSNNLILIYFYWNCSAIDIKIGKRWKAGEPGVGCRPLIRFHSHLSTQFSTISKRMRN